MNLKTAIAAFLAGLAGFHQQAQVENLDGSDALDEEDEVRHQATPAPEVEVDDPGQAWQGQQPCLPISDQTPGEGGILHSPLGLDADPTMTRESMGHSMTPDSGPGMGCNGGGMEMDL